MAAKFSEERLKSNNGFAKGMEMSTGTWGKKLYTEQNYLYEQFCPGTRMD